MIDTNTPNDITIKKRSYRGTNSFTVHWNANGFPDQKDFDDEASAQAYVRNLKRELAESKADQTESKVEQSETWVEQMKVYLELLQISPDELNQFLSRLAQTTKRSFSDWVAHANKGMRIRASINTLAASYDLSPEDLIDKLQVLEGEPIDDVIAAYQRYNFTRAETHRLLNEYIKQCQLEEDDEDEVQFIRTKLDRMLQAFKYDVFAIDDIQVEKWLSVQKGSENAKCRLLDIITTFRTYAEQNKAEVPSAFVA